jgi:prepilin signal peptidase PulO-like enzyme (type II secretory pathway)
MEITMGLFLLSILFVLGAIVGSFLNVVILRHNTGRSLSGRSGCAVCTESLGILELIPIVSYIYQRGRCSHCKSAISSQYILVEIATAILFSLVGIFTYMYQFGFIVMLLLLLSMSIIVVLATYDFRHTILPDKFVYLFITLAIITVYIIRPDIYVLGWHLIGGLTTALPIFTLWYFSKGRAMGFGDVKLSVGIGIFLGMYLGISALWYAFIIGAIYGVVLMALKRAGAKSEVAFGPFIILGFIITLFTQVGFMELINAIMFV